MNVQIRSEEWNCAIFPRKPVTQIPPKMSRNNAVSQRVVTHYLSQMIIKDSRKLHEDAGSDWKIEELLGDRTLKNAIKKKRYATSSVSIHNFIDELNT